MDLWACQRRSDTAQAWASRFCASHTDSLLQGHPICGLAVGMTYVSCRMEKVFWDLDTSFPPLRRRVSQTYSVQDKHQKPCASRCQEQRNKWGTSCVEKILIKIALALCVGSATLLILILTVMRSKRKRLSLRPFIFLVLMGRLQPTNWLTTERGASAAGAPPVLPGPPPPPSGP